MKKLFYFLVAILAILAVPSPVFAQSDPPLDPAGPVALDDTMASVRLSALVVTMLVGTVIPVLVGLLSRWNSKHKGALMIVLNVATALITTATLADGTAVFSQQMLITVVPGLVTSLATYYGILKPNGITSSAVPIPGSEPGTVTLVPGVLAEKGIH